jgi:hypothetical protein
MVPFFGITGSAIATVLSYGLLAWLSRPPASSGFRVPGVPRLLAAGIVGSVAVTLALGEVPTTNEWLALRLAICAASVVVFLLLIRRVIAGLGETGRLVTSGAELGDQKTGETQLAGQIRSAS